MGNAILASIPEIYRWDLSFITFVGIIALGLIAKKIVLLVPTFKKAYQLNQDNFHQKMEKPNYTANQARNRKWGMTYMAVIFVLIMPFCLTLEPLPWWNLLLDIFVILMFYDFFYYLTHRFLFHDSAFLGGPLKWVHAVHHRQHNPCRMDSSYIHPLEVALGLGLYVASIAVLSLLMGKFHVATIVISWIAFSQINLHNHDLWESDRFPFKYLNFAAQMHHNHHTRFTGGNFATISPLYDWMFGSLDHGEGWGEHTVAKKPAKQEAQA